MSQPAGRRFFQVDVFGEVPGTGNPLAVVLDAEGLTDEEMRRFSSWTNLSECTFVLPPEDRNADYRVRIFAGAGEVPFAGHPTLGTARAWLEAGGTPATPGVVVQECGAGLVPVTPAGERLFFVAPPRTRSGPVDPDHLTEVVDILGIGSADVLDAEWLDNGTGFVGVLLESADAVRAVRANASGHPGEWDIGLLGLRAPDSELALEVRALFTDGSGPLQEDPVTGSLNAAAAEWLVGTGRLTTPYIAAQGEAIGRRGRVRVEGELGSLRIGGRADVVIRGEVRI